MTKDKNKDKGENGTDEDDQALWDFVARTVKPLKNNKFHPDKIDTAPDNAIDKKGVRKKQVKPSAPVPSSDARAAGHGSSYKRAQSGNSAGAGEIDKRLDERLRRGQLPIDMFIDLHGHTQEEAHHILQTTLTAAHRAQKRCILVITGKGRHSPREEGSRKLHHGVLKQKVPEWLSTPPLSDIVLKYHGARPKDGGAGALYVLLRRKR